MQYWRGNCRNFHKFENAISHCYLKYAPLLGWVRWWVHAVTPIAATVMSARRKRREERLKEPFVGVELLRLIFILQLQSGQGQVQHQSFGYLQTQRKTAYPINLIEGLRTSRAWGYIFNRVKWKTFCWTSRKVSFLGKLYNNYRFQSL